AHHVIVQESNSLKYYKMDANGNSDNAITIESSSVVSPSICGDNNRLYVVYRKSSENYIRTKFSSDGGSTWSYLSSNPQNSNANSMESVFSNNKLHVTFDVSNVAYYSYYNTENPGWSSLQTVSYSENGTTPRITALYTSTQDRVMFLYKKTSTESRWREWNVTNNSWATNPQTAFTVSSSYSSDPKGIAVDANYIYSYYEFTVYNPYGIYSQLQQRLRSNNSLVTTSVAQSELSVPKIFSTTTTDNISHTAFYYNGVLEGGYEIGIMRNKHTGSGISADPAYPYEFGSNQPTMINISSASNDVFVVWKDGLSNYLKLVYDDQNPLAPANYSVSAYQSGTNYYPRLTWSLNNEPDVRGNSTDAYKIERRTRPLNGTWSSWSELANLSGTTSSYIDYTINNASGGDREAEYRITAIDIGDNTSSTQSVIIEYGQNILDKMKINGMVSNYALDQNYPNPFNPSTKISYSIKEDGLVTLKVYDVLGKEIATLVNENKATGNYEVDFNASELPSGVYIYTLQVNGFTSSKKMLLMK
ncbi:MAG TPA: T9SS type A sorting domain-containing protein, partial [Ignavibacteriaceae bacterium]